MRSLRTVALLPLILAASLSWSQTGTSTIRGTITDPNGSVVSGATVTLINTQTNSTRTTKSNDTGSYVFDLITPATYRVEVDATGFKKKGVENVQALIGKPTEANVTLEIGSAKEVVEVTASSQQALINTQDATLGNNFDSLQITQLPLEARNLVDLLSLQPGSTREGYVTGARADQSNVTLDGVDINNAQSGNAEIPRTTNSLVVGGLDNDRGDITSGPVLRLNSEAVEEFRVTTANGNANQGRSSGAQINIVTKQGTNAWHGAAAEFYRSRGFTANDWFNNHSTPTVDRPPLVRNTFEAALGGPLVKNKLFFFYDYAGRRDASSQTVSRIVPLPTLGQGVINYLYCTSLTDKVCTAPASLNLNTNNVYPAVGLNPAAMQALADAAAKFPNNDLTNGDQINTGGFRFNAPTPIKLNAHTARFDFNLNQRQSLFARLQIQNDHQTLPQWLPGSVSPVVWAHNWGMAVGHSWTIGNNWANNFRYGLTRQAFTNSGDSFGDDTEFRFVFQPNGQLHPLAQTVPVHNLTDDLSWVRGNHTIQFGANIRLISNKRTDFFPTGDFEEMNPSYYNGAGSNVKKLFQQFLTNSTGLPGDQDNGQSVSSTREVRDAATAIIGRYTQLQSFFNFAHDGSLQPHGTPSVRDFATQAYDQYVQDTWKVRPSLTLTLGLRYSLERPVYEKNGFEVQPTVPLGQYLAQRVAAANQGNNLTSLITLDKSGPANGRRSMYNWDKNNFQPRIAAAWSPDNGKTSLRGGFAMTNDYFGQALAVDFDLNSSIGYVENFLNHANSFDVTSAGSAGPQFTQFGQPVLPLVNADFPGVVPSTLVLPSALPALNGSIFGERIEQSLDSSLHAPTQYTWNFTIERQLPKGGVFSASYIGRAGRNLLARRDIAQFSNLRDPKTGVDWYTAATALEKLRQKYGTDAAINQVPNLPSKIQQYFNDMFPAGMAQKLQDFDYAAPCNSTQAPDSGWDCGWSNAQALLAYSGSAVDFYTGNDWTDIQADVDNALAFTPGVSADPVNGDPNAMRFMQPQFGALSAWSSIGNANYNALTLSFRQRLKYLTFDLNYTFAHSLDDASGLQAESGYGNNSGGNGAFILNSLRQRENYASSDFDVKHSINADFIWQVPVGRGQALMPNAGKVADALLGGWQLSSIIRWNTGLPTGASPFDEGQWATSWEVQSNTTPTRSVHSCPNKPANSAPKIFGSCDTTAIYQSMRNAYPGESGPRNYIRYPGYFDLDLGLSKSFKMPWEGHRLALRWDVFNVTNTQSLTGIVDFSVVADPGTQTPPPDWGNLFQIQGQARVMQIGARYSF